MKQRSTTYQQNNTNAVPTGMVIGIVALNGAPDMARKIF